MRSRLFTDEHRESMIERVSLQFQAAQTQDERRELWAQLRELINGRSKALVEQMERNRGLR
jgi:hypothetical protein